MKENLTLSRNILQVFLITCIIVLSFRFYSSNYYPALNSDDAVNILMTHHIDLPQDLYFWGQDRAGSIIPITGKFFYEVLGFSPVTSVSLANYLFLIIGYIGFSSLFKTRFSKIVFAFLWFLPAARFIDLMRMQIGVQYTIIALAIFLINRVSSSENNMLSKKDHLLLFIITFLFVVDFWVSDISILSFFIIALVLWYYHYRKTKKIFFRIGILLYGITGVLVGYLFVRYAKSYADQEIVEYLQRNSFDELAQAVKLVKMHIGNLVKFKANEPFMSIWCYFVGLLILVSGYLLFSKKLTLTRTQKIWMVFLITDFCLMFAAIMFSKWTLLNGMGRRYFVGNYIVLTVLVVIIIESANLPVVKKTILKGLFVIMTIIGSFSTFHYLVHIFPKSLRPKIDIVGEFKQLGKIGLIGEYWNGYISACADPDNIKATPHDKSTVRNLQLALEALNQPKLFLIKDMWLDDFPDTIFQFGQRLVKKSSPMQLGDCIICEYSKQ